MKWIVLYGSILGIMFSVFYYMVSDNIGCKYCNSHNSACAKMWGLILIVIICVCLMGFGVPKYWYNYSYAWLLQRPNNHNICGRE